VHPEIRGARLDPDEREPPLAELLRMAVFSTSIERSRRETLVQPVELLLDCLARALGGCDFFANGGRARCSDLQRDSLTRRMG
jgi:hypothetical protein